MSWSARLAVVMVSVGMLGSVAPALGDTNVKFDAKIRVVGGGERMQYHGRVRSNLEHCQVGRTVRITNAGRLIGQAATDETGRFSLKAGAAPDGSSVKFKLKPNRPDCPPATLYVEI